MRYEVPISEELIDELFPFWASIFGEVLPDIAREVFLALKMPIAGALSTCEGKKDGWQARASRCSRKWCRVWQDSVKWPRTRSFGAGA